MGLFGSKRGPARSARDAAELALDLTPEAIVLYEREPGGPWRKFASAALDDPELPIVIGFLRSEAERSRGLRKPVRLWLPSDQVLCYRAPVSGATARDRLRAGFDFVAAETVYRAKDVAIAVAPPDASGDATILLTYATTWNEARSYAARWGFQPGPVSTRQQAADFGSDGPVFELVEALEAPPPRDRRPALAAGAGLAAAVIAAAAWLTWPAPEPLPDPTATGLTAEPSDTEPAQAWLPAPSGPEGTAPPETPGSSPRLAGTPPEVPLAAATLADLGKPNPVAEAPGPYLTAPTPRVRASPVTAVAEAGTTPDGAPITTAGSHDPIPVERAAPPAPRAGPEPDDPPHAAPHPGADETALPLPQPRPDRILRMAKRAAMAATLPVPRPKSRTRPAAALPKLAAPSPPKIARGATLSGLPLDQTTFIGVISLHSGRKALLRLPDGSVRSVEVGDILDGWRVSAIGAEQMRMSRNGRDRTLLLVSR